MAESTTDAVASAQALLDMSKHLPVVAQGHARAAVSALLTPLCGGSGQRAAEVADATLARARSASPVPLAEVLADYRRRWAEAERAHLAAGTLYLTSDGEVRAEQHRYDQVILQVGNGATVDPLAVCVVLTGREGLALVRLLMAQPAVRDAQRDADAVGEAGGGA